MNDGPKTISQLTAKITKLQKKVAALKSANAAHLKSKKHLQAYEAKFRAIIENAPVAIYYSDVSGRFLYGNKKAESITGYQREEFIGQSFLKLNLLDAAGLQKAVKLLALNKLGRPTGPDEFKLRRKDGTTILVEITTEITSLEGKRVIVGMVQDITEHRQMAEALEKSKERYRSIFENVSDFVYFHDLDGSWLETNMSIRRGWGYSAEELERMSVRDMVPERHRPQFDVYLQRILKNGKDEGIFKLVTKDGRERIVEYKNDVLYDGDRPMVVAGLARDITERIRTEKTLKESEEKYRTILENMEEGYYELDHKGNFTFVNDAAYRMLEYEHHELINMNYREIMEAETAEIAFQVFNRVYTTGIPDKAFDWTLTTKDGRNRHIEVSVQLRKNQKGEPVGFRGIARDVTEQRSMEAERKRLEERLLHAQKMEAIGTLAGGVAHDLNNILSGLVSYPELLLMDLPDGSPLKKPILTIQKSGQRAAAIVQDLLTLARRGVPVWRVVNLNTIIADYLKSPEFQKLISFHPKVSIKTHLEPALLNIMGSGVHLSKAVMNLVSNAAEAMPWGGEIRLFTENRHVDRTLRGYDNVEPGDYATLTVIDSGVGLDDEDRKRIFEPFYTKKSMGRSGTGLGMTVVYGTVKDHHGFIDIRSIRGRGTTIILYFPITHQKISKTADSHSMGRYAGKGESILIVDDAPEQREIASRMIKKLGYQAHTADSGEAAITFLQKTPVDLLVLDMIMDPGIDGLETYKRILKINPRQKAIIVSGYSETERVKQAQKLGAGQYVKKPYVIETLAKAIRTALDK